jgi:hypothetical protein
LPRSTRESRIARRCGLELGNRFAEVSAFFGDDWYRGVLDALVAETHGRRNGSLLEEIDLVLAQMDLHGVDLSLSQDTPSVMSRHVMRSVRFGSRPSWRAQGW